MESHVASNQEPRLRTRLTLLSVGAGIVTVAFKSVAWALTGSPGRLSGAIESPENRGQTAGSYRLRTDLTRQRFRNG
jgi:hypothetical protein